MSDVAVPITTAVTDKAAYGPTYLDVDHNIDYDAWQALGYSLGAMYRSSGWWVGDWFRAGEERWEDDAYQFAEEIGLARGTIQNYVTTASNVERDIRRPELSFSHHVAVQMLGKGEQRKWLARAVKEGWSHRDLRNALADAGLIQKRVGKPAEHVEFEAGGQDGEAGMLTCPHCGQMFDPAEAKR